ncbi:DnaJ-like cysteine-rich domain-containing protein [Parvularcula lutaonensis]|uniref:Uncharacterized protein n=1 Tax=Parvularcula lutaonensis TaxID=491923 RepID=A0ABV7M8B6_9PROT|nr:hypothetical protein [Parvularcula lutaonensis]GGY44334.1 hypothetical protein GCM10007148_11530 [Parvularcula lutaonensis]
MSGAMTGPGWTGSRILAVMQRMGLDPRPAEPEAGDDLRIISGLDPASQLPFGAMYFAEPHDGVSYLSLIALIEAPGLTEAGAKRIGARLSVATAFIDQGHLCVFAELNTKPPFTDDFFSTQLDFFLKDLRLAAQMLFGSSDMTFRAVDAFREVRRRRGDSAPIVRALLGRSKGDAFTAATVTCSRCNGTGRRFLRPCRDCYGTGEKR